MKERIGPKNSERVPFLQQPLIKWLLILLGLLAWVGFFVWLAILSDLQKADALITSLLSLLGVISSTATAILMGRESAIKSVQNNLAPFLRSAFRGHVGLVEGLRRLEQRITTTQPGSGSEAEISSVIANIKDLLGEQIERAAEQLEDWRQLAPVEVTYYERQVQQKSSEVNQFTEVITQLDSLRGGLNQLSSTNAELNRIVGELRAERTRLAESSPLAVGAPARGETHRLLLAGAVQTAIDRYSRLIQSEPLNYTLYLGRAKAMSLVGQKEQALQDLTMADTLHPGDPSIQRMREQVETGGILTAPVLRNPEALQVAFEGNKSLAAGDGQKALNFYRRAKDLGFLPVYCHQNFAMAWLVMGDAESARGSLLQINNDRMGPYVLVQYQALLTLCDIFQGVDNSGSMHALSEAIRSVGVFSLQQSPLRFLEDGFREKGLNLREHVQQVFSLLKRESNQP